jgi:glycosyltransferase involved in cell wall biosynthesis
MSGPKLSEPTAYPEGIVNPSSIHHVFPYHVDQIADGVESWWSTQLGVWPVAAALDSGFGCNVWVHVIGDEDQMIDRLVVHRGTIAGAGVQQFGCDFSASMYRSMKGLRSSDVCFIHGADAPAADLYADAARHARIIAVYHGGATGGPDRLKDLAARHVVLRGEVAATLIEWGYSPESIVEVVPSIAPGFFEARIGFVGRPTLGKGIDSIVPTMRALRDAGYDASIEIVGNTHLDDPTQLRDAVQAEGCDFEARGFLPNRVLPGIMATWDVLLFPSRWEGLGRSVLEAAAAGIPVVAVRGVMPDKVVDGMTVVVVDREDVPAAVVDAVRRSPSVPRLSVARTHAEGTEDLDRIIDSLPDTVSSRPASIRARVVAGASILRHWESIRRIGRPFVSRWRRWRWPRRSTV